MSSRWKRWRKWRRKRRGFLRASGTSRWEDAALADPPRWSSEGHRRSAPLRSSCRTPRNLIVARTRIHATAIVTCKNLFSLMRTASRAHEGAWFVATRLNLLHENVHVNESTSGDFDKIQIGELDAHKKGYYCGFIWLRHAWLTQYINFDKITWGSTFIINKSTRDFFLVCTYIFSCIHIYKIYSILCLVINSVRYFMKKELSYNLLNKFSKMNRWWWSSAQRNCKMCSFFKSCKYIYYRPQYIA